MKIHSILLFLILPSFLTPLTCHGSMEAQQTLTSIFNRVGNLTIDEQTRIAQPALQRLTPTLSATKLTARGKQILATFAAYEKEKSLAPEATTIHILYSLLTDSPSVFPGRDAARYPEKTSCLTGYNAGWSPWGSPNDEYRQTYTGLSNSLAQVISALPQPGAPQSSAAPALTDKPGQTPHKKRSALNITTGMGVSVTALGLAWLFTTVHSKRNRDLLAKAWRQLTSAAYREELALSETPLEKELIFSHGREALAALLVTLAGAATTVYGIKKA